MTHGCQSTIIKKGVEAMTAIERIRQIEEIFRPGHPVCIACKRAAYDIECIEVLRQADLAELRELRRSCVVADELRIDELLLNLRIYRQIVIDTINNIQLMADKAVDIFAPLDDTY